MCVFHSATNLCAFQKCEFAFLSVRLCRLCQHCCMQSASLVVNFVDWHPFDQWLFDAVVINFCFFFLFSLHFFRTISIKLHFYYRSLFWLCFYCWLPIERIAFQLKIQNSWPRQCHFLFRKFHFLIKLVCVFVAFNVRYRSSFKLNNIFSIDRSINSIRMCAHREVGMHFFLMRW